MASVEEFDGREALQQASWSVGVGDHVLCLEVEAGLGTLAASADLGQRVAGSWLVASDLEEADVSVVALLGDGVSCGALGEVHHVALEAVDIGLVGGSGGDSGSRGSDSSGGSSEVSRLVLVSDGFVVDGGRVGGGVGGGGGVVVVEVVAEPGVVAAVSAVVEASVEAVRVVRSEGVGRVSEGESSRVISGVLRLGEGDGGGKKTRSNSLIASGSVSLHSLRLNNSGGLLSSALVGDKVTKPAAESVPRPSGSRGLLLSASVGGAVGNSATESVPRPSGSNSLRASDSVSFSIVL